MTGNSGSDKPTWATRDPSAILPKPPKWLAWGLMATIAALFVWVYTTRLGLLPPRWEEPRRCMVAYEMIERGDYVVPTVYRELYTKKPPLQNWLIALAAGFNRENIHVRLSRIISVVSVFLVAAMLWGLAHRSNLRWAWLSAAIFLSLGFTIQYGRAGEVDPLFVLWTTAALGTFYVGYKNADGRLAWIIPQIFIAFGVLTKGLAPAFVYPPVALFLGYEWLRSKRLELKPTPWKVLSGLGMAAFILAAWLVPLAWSGALVEFGKTGAEEVWARGSSLRGWTAIVAGLARYPFEVWVNLLPWSLLSLGLALRSGRQLLRETLAESSIFRFALCVVGWVVVCLWLMPGSLGRYVMPAYPFFALALGAILSRIPATSTRGSVAMVPVWLLLTVAFAAFAIHTHLESIHVEIAAPLLAAALAFGVAAIAHRSDEPSLIARALLLAGFFYSAAFAAIHQPSRVADDLAHHAHSRQMAQTLKDHAASHEIDLEKASIGCSRRASQAMCFEFVQVLERSLGRPEATRGPSYGVGHRGRHPLPDGAEILAEGFGDFLWFKPSP